LVACYHIPSKMDARNLDKISDNADDDEHPNEDPGQLIKDCLEFLRKVPEEDANISRPMLACGQHHNDLFFARCCCIIDS
jgi:hypothetical protein